MAHRGHSKHTQGTCEYFSQFKDWLMCEECGELQKMIPISLDHQLQCHNCHSVLQQSPVRWLNVSLALTVTASVLFLVLMNFPFLEIEFSGLSHTVSVWGCFLALIWRESYILAAVFFATLVVFPVFELCCLLFVLVTYKLRRRMLGQRTLLRWLIRAKDWNMLEIFLLSLIVASIKMGELTQLNLQVGVVALFALVVCLLTVQKKLNTKTIWQWITPNNYFTFDEQELVYDCHVCHAMVGESIVESEGECPRCDADVFRRIPHSLHKASALLVAAVVLYVPAMLLPVMTYQKLGDIKTATLWDGVQQMFASGMYGIGFIVFVASIFVPVLKFVLLFYLIYSVKSATCLSTPTRLKLYRLTHLIGRWSMVDVFVVTLFVAVVQFGWFYSIEPGFAIVAFGAVVVLTMAAAEAFDPRLLWDETLQTQHNVCTKLDLSGL